MSIHVLSRLKFSLNGRTKIELEQDCGNDACTPDIQLPADVEDTINKFVHNASFLHQKTDWIQNVSRIEPLNTKTRQGMLFAICDHKLFPFVLHSGKHNNGPKVLPV